MAITRRKKEDVVRDIPVEAKALFLLSKIFQAVPRILTLVMLGHVVFPGDKLTPLYLIAMCVGHILFVFATKLIIRGRCEPGARLNVFLCSIASVFLYVTMDNTNRGESDNKPNKSDLTKKKDT